MEYIYDTQLAKGIMAAGNVLTLETAASLKGKTILATFRGYRDNRPYVMKFTVGEIVDKDNIANLELDDEDKQQAIRTFAHDLYRDSIYLFEADGKNSHIFTYPEDPAFWCTDRDRTVFYKIVD